MQGALLVPFAWFLTHTAYNISMYTVALKLVGHILRMSALVVWFSPKRDPGTGEGATSIQA